MQVFTCKCLLLESRVHPVMVLSAWFCIICSVEMFVSDVMGDQIVFGYSMIGRAIVSYTAVSVSLAFPQRVNRSDLSIFIVCFDLVSAYYMRIV